MVRHKVFISYHHANDQDYKEKLLKLNVLYDIFIDRSVRDGDIDPNLPTESIRIKIRDNWLKDSTVTILLCGAETQYRKHVDWELKSSMINGTVNKKSGILIIDLPTTSSTSWHADHYGEKNAIYPNYQDGWERLTTKSQYISTYPEMPDRIIDNLHNLQAAISVVPWNYIENSPNNLAWLIEATANSRSTNKYDLSRPMRMKDHNPNSFW